MNYREVPQDRGLPYRVFEGMNGEVIVTDGVDSFTLHTDLTAREWLKVVANKNYTAISSDFVLDLRKWLKSHKGIKSLTRGLTPEEPALYQEGQLVLDHIYKSIDRGLKERQRGKKTNI